jgi:DNA polymerase III psi subunit
MPLSELDSSSRIIARESTRLTSSQSLRLRARHWASLTDRERLRAWLHGEEADAEADTARILNPETEPLKRETHVQRTLYLRPI